VTGSETLAAAGDIALGLVFAGIGLALATDFRGVTSWHVRGAIRAAQPLTRIPPWRWLPSNMKDPERQFASQYRLERAIGWAFFVVGFLPLIAGLGKFVTTIF
jgi:hypothetical protein